MSCINPIQVSTRVNNKVKNIEVSCGHCLNCMIKKESQIEFLAKRELVDNYRKGLSAAFCTLTYDDNHIPYNENGFVTLCRKDVQNFLKNMRRQMDYYKTPRKFKVLYCGEYGDGSHSTSNSGVSTNRPHYHIVFIGLSPEEVKAYTKKLWKNGLCDVGPLGAGGIRYLCKYMMKSTCDKEVKELREVAGVQNPFFYHSIGMAKEWICRNLQKIVYDEFTFNLNGKKNLFPKYVMQFVSNHTGVDFHPYVIKFLKEEKLPYAKKQGISYSQYDYDNSFINYRYKVAALRSQNKPINDITMSKKWIRPFSTPDRSIRKLAEIAFNSVDRTIKNASTINYKIDRKSVSNYDGSINWKKYFDICYVRENVPF